MAAAADVGRAVLACVRSADENGFLSASAAASEAEQMQAWMMQQNTGTQLVVKIPDGGVGRAGRAVLACVRPSNENDEFSGWQRPGPCRAGLQERKKAGGAIQGDAALRTELPTELRGGGTSAPCPEGWRRPGQCRAGTRSWRSSSTSALLPTVLEEDRADAVAKHHGGGGAELLHGFQQL